MRILTRKLLYVQVMSIYNTKSTSLTHHHSGTALHSEMIFVQVVLIHKNVPRQRERNRKAFQRKTESHLESRADYTYFAGTMLWILYARFEVC